MGLRQGHADLDLSVLLQRGCDEHALPGWQTGLPSWMQDQMGLMQAHADLDLSLLVKRGCDEHALLRWQIPVQSWRQGQMGLMQVCCEDLCLSAQCQHFVAAAARKSGPCAAPAWPEQQHFL